MPQPERDKRKLFVHELPATFHLFELIYWWINNQHLISVNRTEDNFYVYNIPFPMVIQSGNNLK